MDDHHGQDIGQRVGTRQAEHFRKFHNAQHFAAQGDGLTSLDVGETFKFYLGGFRHGVQRNGVHLAGHIDHQSVDDRQGQRQAQGEARALAHFGIGVDAAFEIFDVGAHHVHAHAAPGNIRDFFGGGEARRENQFHGLTVIQLRRFLGRDDALADSHFAHFIRVNALAVVFNLNGDGIALVKGAQGDLALGRLARSNSHVFRFNAVVHGVADQMHQGIADNLHHALVQFRFFAFHDQIDFLAAFARKVADQAGEARKDRRNGHHADFHDGVLQIVGNTGHGVGGFRKALGHFRNIHVLAAAFKGAGNKGVTVAVDDQLADQIHQMIKALVIYADRGGTLVRFTRRSGSRRCLCGGSHGFGLGGGRRGGGSRLGGWGRSGGS